MNNKNDIYKTRLRDNRFTSRTITRIHSEQPSQGNPYIADNCRLHGYDLFELISKRNLVDVIFLILQGELPTREQEKLFETLLIGLISPGSRHPATRAAMNTAIGKTDVSHILPISLSILGGKHLGGCEVTASMQFINKNYQKDPGEVAQKLIQNAEQPRDGDLHIAPGFGTRFGSIDSVPTKLATTLADMAGNGKSLIWCSNFVDNLQKHGYGWLITGVAAATLSDLGFHPRAGAGLFQIACAPGLLAHGLELSNKPITSLPFIDDEQYFIES